MRKINIFLVFGVILFSCTYGTREGVVQKESKSFLHFIGNAENVSVVIDGGEPFALEKELDDVRYKPNLLYQVSPGKHALKLYRNSQLIMDRIVFISSNETKEIEIE